MATALLTSSNSNQSIDPILDNDKTLDKPQQTNGTVIVHAQNDLDKDDISVDDNKDDLSQSVPTFYPIQSNRWKNDPICICCEIHFKKTKTKRHHCRYCGFAVCDDCSKHEIDGYRICNICHINPPILDPDEIKLRQSVDKTWIKTLENIPGVGYMVAGGHWKMGDNQRARRAFGKNNKSNIIFIFSAIGGSLGAIVGPPGMVIGAGVGGAVGAVIGTAAEHGIKNTIQSVDAKNDMEDFNVKNVTTNVLSSTVGCVGGAAASIGCKLFATSGQSLLCPAYKAAIQNGQIVIQTTSGWVQDIGVILAQKILPTLASSISGNIANIKNIEFAIYIAQDHRPQLIVSDYESTTRIIRIKKVNIVKVVPLIFYQELNQLDCLTDDEREEQKNDLQQEILEDVEQFILYCMLYEKQFYFKKKRFCAQAAIKFKYDAKDTNYIYMSCLAYQVNSIYTNDHLDNDQNDQIK